MRTRLFIAAMLLCTAAATAKDIKTAVFTTRPEMHCEGCENRIKNNLRFEKGIKKIETDVPNQAVTITYDADKTDIQAIIKGFKKIDYDATVKQDCAEKSCCAEQEGGNGVQQPCTSASKSCPSANKSCCTDK